MTYFVSLSPGGGARKIFIAPTFGKISTRLCSPKSPHVTFEDVAQKLTTNGLTDIAGMKPDDIAPYIDDLEVMQHLQRNSILIAAEELWTLVLRGFDKKILGIIEKLPEEIQARVLSKNRMIWSLCYSDHAADIVRVIGKMNERNQKRLFDIPGVVPMLLRHNQEEGVQQIMGSWTRRRIDFTMPTLTAG